MPFPGCVIVPSAAVGQVLGGLIARWRRLQVRGLLIQCAVGCGLAGLLSLVFLLKCDLPKIAGVTVSYDGYGDAKLPICLNIAVTFLPKEYKLTMVPYKPSTLSYKYQFDFYPIYYI